MATNSHIKTLMNYFYDYGKLLDTCVEDAWTNKIADAIDLYIQNDCKENQVSVVINGIESMYVSYAARVASQIIKDTYNNFYRDHGINFTITTFSHDGYNKNDKELFKFMFKISFDKQQTPETRKQRFDRWIEVATKAGYDPFSREFNLNNL